MEGFNMSSSQISALADTSFPSPTSPEKGVAPDVIAKVISNLKELTNRAGNFGNNTKSVSIMYIFFLFLCNKNLFLFLGYKSKIAAVILRLAI